MLKISDGALELIDCSQMLPGFKYLPGFTNWKVFDSQMNQYSKYEDLPEAFKQSQIQHPYFPDPDFNKENNLQFCVRMLPHLINDGGFFAALIKKVKPLPWENGHRTLSAKVLHDKYEFYYSSKLRRNLKSEFFNESIPKKKPNRKPVDCGRGRKIKFYFKNKDSYQFVEKNDENIENLTSFYDMPKSFETDSFFNSGAKNIFLTNKAVKNLIQGDLDVSPRVRDKFQQQIVSILRL